MAYRELIIPVQGEFCYTVLTSRLGTGKSLTFFTVYGMDHPKVIWKGAGGCLPPKTNGRNKLCLLGGGQIISFFDPLRDRSMRSFFITLSCPACDTIKFFYSAPGMYFLNLSFFRRIKENTPRVFMRNYKWSISQEASTITLVCSPNAIVWSPVLLIINFIRHLQFFTFGPTWQTIQ